MSLIVKEVTAVGGQVTAMSRRARKLCVFNWVIPKFFTLCPQGSTNFSMLKSPTFIAGEDVGQESEWRVIVWGLDGTMAINLQLTPNSPVNEGHFLKGLAAKFTISLCSRTDRFEKVQTTEHKFDRECDRWGYVQFVEICELYKQKATLLEDGALRICVQIEIEAQLTPQNLVPMIISSRFNVEVKKKVKEFHRDCGHIMEVIQGQIVKELFSRYPEVFLNE